jgi:hypothetical protein
MGRIMHSLIRRSLLLAFMLMTTTAMVPVAAADATLTRVVGDVTVHLGVTPVAKAVERETSHASEVTHGRKRVGKAAQHVVVALFETKSGERITDAQVSVTVAELGLNTEEKPLARMTVGGVTSYGNTFDIRPGGRYTIKVAIRRPGVHTPVETSFDYSRP